MAYRQARGVFFFLIWNSSFHFFTSRLAGRPGAVVDLRILIREASPQFEVGLQCSTLHLECIIVLPEHKGEFHCSFGKTLQKAACWHIFNVGFSWSGFVVVVVALSNTRQYLEYYNVMFMLLVWLFVTAMFMLFWETKMTWHKRRLTPKTVLIYQTCVLRGTALRSMFLCVVWNMHKQFQGMS